MSVYPYQLPRTVKSVIFQVITRLGLEPSDFKWKPVEQRAGTGEALEHRPTGSYITVVRSVHPNFRLWVEFHPATPDGAYFAGAQSEIMAQNLALDWLHRVKREHETPDLWQALAADRELIVGEVIDGDDRFSGDDLQRLRERLDALKSQVARIAEASAEQQRVVDKKFDELKASAETLSRKEWKTIFVGTLFEAIVDLALDPARASQVFHFATLYIGPLITRVAGLIA